MLENIYMVRDIINLAGGQIKGRKKMQKIIYILQQLAKPFRKPYEFRWNFYGVYSDELASELNVGEIFGILRERCLEEHGYRTFIIETVDNSNASGIEKDEQVKQLVTYLAAKESRVLEVLSSIIFFKDQGYADAALEEKLHVFKGHLASFFDEAFTTYNELTGVRLKLESR
ncbi:hypothetical protein [Desulfallas thermosapovorans]|uniref:Uncharacterized protein n=1 Tax=Desulfallas thermosapovorans DSM 6562 TaxID=1121431 RepID=A0A5S4ZUM2_9FIRM|nr:hypothetical protein [Desulfallas thermosapovorans]TYO96608.1 hypothetical protein LX24_01077 [Desulfallas thermosapovorans DSM 6562]